MPAICQPRLILLLVAGLLWLTSASPGHAYRQAQPSERAITLGPTHPERRLVVTMPRGAHQGPRRPDPGPDARWWVGDLIGRVRVVGTVRGHRHAMLLMGVDGHAVLMVDIDVRGRQVTIGYLTIGSGQVERSGAGSVAIDATNYLQQRSIGRGRHEVLVWIQGDEPGPPPPWLRVDLFSNTGVHLTTEPAYRTRVEVVDGTGSLALRFRDVRGAAVPDLEVLVEDRDGLAVRPVVFRRREGAVEAAVGRPGQRVAGPVTVTWFGPTPSQSGRATLEVEGAPSPGEATAPVGAILLILVSAVGAGLVAARRT